MSLTFSEGERLLGTKLNKLVPRRAVQGFDQSASTETTLEDTNIVVPVDGVTRIWLQVRYESQGTGIKWAWRESAGAVTGLMRTVLTAGASVASGSVFDIPEMQTFAIPSFAGAFSVAHWTVSLLNRVSEELVVSGEGELTFQFAKETSAPQATTIWGQSYARYQNLNG